MRRASGTTSIRISCRLPSSSVARMVMPVVFSRDPIHGKGIFDLIYKNFPTHYWAGPITLAKVLKIEIGKPLDFDRPSTKQRGARSLGAHRRTACAQDAGTVLGAGAAGRSQVQR